METCLVLRMILNFLKIYFIKKSVYFRKLEVIGSPRARLMVIVSHPTWVLGTELKFSTGAVCAFNH